MDLQEVKKFLSDNAAKDDVKAYLSDLSRVSSEKETEIVENYKKSQDFKSEIDRANTRAINTYREKTLPGLIEDQVKAKESELESKYNPPKNPVEEKLRKDIEEMKTKMAASERKIIQEAIKSEKQRQLAEKGIPVELADSIYIDMSNIKSTDIDDKEKLQILISPALESILKYGDSVKTGTATEMITRGGGKPQASNSQTNSGQLTVEQYNALPTREERIKAQNEGRTKQILGQI
jgi:hypothetical protein